MEDLGFREFADLLPDALLLVSADGTVLAANQAAVRFLQPNATDVRGHALWQWTTEDANSIREFLRLCSRTRNRVVHALTMQAQGQSQICRIEGCLSRPRQGELPAQILLRILPREATTARFLLLNERIEQLGREVARRTRAEEELRRERGLLQVTLASIGDAVLVTDQTGAVTFLNAIAESLTGWSAADAVGKPVEHIFHIVNEQTRQLVESPVTKVLREGQIVGLANHTVLIARDGSERPIDDSGAPIRDTNGDLLGVVLVFRDVSERKQVEYERERLLLSERHARNEAERAGRLKDEFLATLSHELRTPLNAVLGYATLLQMKPPTPTELHDAVETIARNGRLQAQLIDDLLDMNRIISGKIRLNIELVDWPEVIRAALKTVQPSADAKGVRLQLELDPQAGLVHGDPSRLQQVVWNLLSNAVKFTPPGGRVQIGLMRRDNSVELTVRDNGQGIVPEFLPYVFDRFRQADSTITRHFGGLGLGLSIVKHLAELHGGTVEAASSGPGEGATFWVRLPLAGSTLPLPDEPEGSPGSPANPPAAPRGLPQELPNLAGVRVLIVDDEPDACGVVAGLLQKCQAAVETATSASQALDRLRAHLFDVLISDIGMPGMDGYQLIREVRSWKGTHGSGSIPAIALTAFARSEDRQRAAFAGFSSHVAKPVEAMELLAVVASLTGRTGG